MNEHRSARPAHRLQAARDHLGGARRELQQAYDMARAGGGDAHVQLEEALAHLGHLEELVADAERHLPEEPEPGGRGEPGER